MIIAEAIAKRIQKLLLEKKITQYRLAKDMAIHHKTLHNVMTAQHNGVNIKTLLLICQGLGISIKEFFNDPMFESDKIDIE